MNQTKIKNILFTLIAFIVLYIAWKILWIGIATLFKLLIPVAVLAGIYYFHRISKKS